MVAHSLTQHADVRCASARVPIRPHLPADLPRLSAIWADTEVMGYMAVPPLTKQQAADKFNTMMRPGEYVRRSHKFAIVRRQNNAVVGTIDMNLERLSSAYAHPIVMHREAWGHGLAAEALDLLVRFGFEALGVHRVWTACEVRNEAAKRLILRVGPTWFATIREYYQKESKWGNVEAYSYLDHERRAKATSPNWSPENGEAHGQA